MLAKEIFPNGYSKHDNVTLVRYDGQDQAIDSQGTAWRVTEGSLIAKDAISLDWLPYHRAFWFGWHAAYPDTRLIKSLYYFFV